MSERLPGTSLLAAARPLLGTKLDNPATTKQAWQDTAWFYYDESGALRYGATWIANLVSRARLCAAKITDNNEPEPIGSGPAADAIAALGGGLDGQTAILHDFGVLLTVPGLGYLVASDVKEGQSWGTYSADELRQKRTAAPGRPALYERQVEGGGWEVLPESTLAVKVWRPHPRLHWQSDSPARAALPALGELRRISQYIDAVLASRVASAGLLVFAQEASFPTAVGKEKTEGVHPFVTEILDVMMTAVKNPGTASGIVPIPVELPADLVDKIRHIDFATALSDRVLDMRESALRQAAIALDIPAEILTGMEAMSHWGAWQIEEGAIKVHAEPLLEVITGALTTGYLHPVLKAQNEDTTDLIVWANTANLTSRPDRSGNAVLAYDRLEINGDALRRETGMSEYDKPSDPELETMIWKKLALNPQLAPTALEGLGIDVPVTSSTPTGTGEVTPPVVGDSRDAGADTNGPPLTNDQPVAPPTGTPPQQAHLLLFETLVHRALERAGNRIRSASRSSAELVDCPPEQAHCCIGGVTNADELLRGAWDRVPAIATELGYDPVLIINRLDEYCAMLLTRGFAHDRETLVAVMCGMPMRITT